MEKTIQLIASVFLFIGTVILIYFMFKSGSDGFTINFNDPTDYETTGLFGDYIGGVVGTLFAFSGTLLIYLSLKLQVKENSKNKIENHFFEMLRIHRENIDELNYSKQSMGRLVTFENRHVISEIFNEFNECYREIGKFSNSKKIDDYLQEDFTVSLKNIAKNNCINIDVIEMAHIDLAYSIVFYGLEEEGESIIRSMFRHKFNEHYFFRLLFFLKIKPKKSNTKRYNKWKEVRSLKLKKLRGLIDELYDNRKNLRNNSLSISAQELELFSNYEKYYGGHQFRLGHYYRHLYQSFKFINNQKSLTEEERYNYGKMYRAQLSTYEQSLLFVNSISSIGMKWEYASENNLEDKPSNLITTFQLIKNVPGDQISGIRFRKYYPKIKYESSEMPH